MIPMDYNKLLDEINALLPKAYRIKIRPLKLEDIQRQMEQFRNDNWSKKE